MAPRCSLTFAPALSPQEYVEAASGMYAAAEAPGASARLGIFGLTDRAILLGRHQRLESALDLAAVRSDGVPILRRETGGAALMAGEGAVAVALALPSTSALLDAPIPLAKLLNRYVRPMVQATVSLGAPCLYFGRDFLSLKSQQGAYVSFDVRPSGAALVEFFLAVQRELGLPPPLSGYPERLEFAPPPPWTTLSRHSGRELDAAALHEAIAAAFVRVLGVEFETGPEPPKVPPPAVLEPEEGWKRSGVGEIPIGFAEALLREDGKRIAEVRLRGDFICPTAAVRRAEQALAGAELELTALGQRVDEAFNDPLASALTGVRSLRIFAEAIVAAAAE